jgi:hypothetical protein|tara:strand:- start:15452 stop:15874 length:423 start_codon:yes stop_codon:yes gene_type:complete
MEFRKFWVSFILVGLVLFSLMAFVVQFQEDHGKSTVLENSVFNDSYQALQTNLTGFRDTSQSQKENFEADPPTLSFGALIIFAIVSAGQIFAGMIVAIFNILIVLPASFLGIPPLVIGIFSSILVLTIILLLWRLFKVGE